MKVWSADAHSVVLLWPFGKSCIKMCGNQSRSDEFHMLFNVKFSEDLKYKHEVKPPRKLNVYFKVKQY